MVVPCGTFHSICILFIHMTYIHYMQDASFLTRAHFVRARIVMVSLQVRTQLHYRILLLQGCELSAQLQLLRLCFQQRGLRAIRL